MAGLDTARAFFETPWLEKTQRVGEFWWALKSRFYYRHFFGTFGTGSKLIAPLRLRNVDRMFIGAGVLIHRHAFLIAMPQPGAKEPRLQIGNGSIIGHMNHIACAAEVTIGNHVLTADRVFISDHSHEFSDIRRPILAQAVSQTGPVHIGDGSWIGENVAILSCRIGRNCVIGANAVVTRDVPDYSVAVGAPARVVRTYNPTTALWEKGRQSE